MENGHTEVKIDGKEYSIMKESDIMGVTKEKNKNLQEQKMAKIIKFDTEARTKMLKGVNTLANAVK